METGGVATTSAGGDMTTGGKSAGGTSSATGGAKNSGGTTSTSNPQPTGGAGTIGGTSSAGSTAVGGRGAGICPGGSYPTPDLSGTATVVASSSTGGQFEGALWLADQGVLLFSGMDTTVVGNTIVPATVERLTLPSTVDTAVANTGTNGLALDFNGNVLGCSQGTTQRVAGIVSINVTAGTATALVSTDANGKHFNSPNDLTVRTDGTIYFTDPDYQIAGRTNETGIKGVYRVDPSQKVWLVDGTFSEPNGISLGPDETTLYVSDTQANKIRKFTVAADGSTSGKTDFVTQTSPDGGAVDCAGNLYWASNAAPGKIVVWSPSGTQIGSIAIGTSDKPTNVAFGGTDHKTLYVSTSPRKIYALTLNVPGFPY